MIVFIEDKLDDVVCLNQIVFDFGVKCHYQNNILVSNGFPFNIRNHSLNIYIIFTSWTI